MVYAAVVGVRMYVLLLHRCIASSRCRYLSISVSEDTHGMTSSTSTPGLRPLTLLLLLHTCMTTTTSGVGCCGKV